MAQTEKEILSAKTTQAVDFERVLQKHHSDLRKSLGIEELIPSLRSLDLLTKDEWEVLSSQQTRQQKIDYLVGLLPRKGENAYTHFVVCLESEKDHPAHQELADKLKTTAAKLAESQQQVLPEITNEYELISEEVRTNTDTVYEKVTEVLKSGLKELGDCIQKLKQKNATLEAELQEKNKLIENLSQNSLKVSPEVANFQKLVEYASWSQNAHGNQSLANFNTQTLAEHYRCARSMLRKVKSYLFRDVDQAKRNIELASDESDVSRSRTSSFDVRSRASSMESQLSKPNLAALRFKKQHLDKDIQENQKEENQKEENQKEIPSSSEEDSCSAGEADDEQNVLQPGSWTTDRKKKLFKAKQDQQKPEQRTYKKGPLASADSKNCSSPKPSARREKSSKKTPSNGSPSLKQNSSTSSADKIDGFECQPATAVHHLKEGQRVIVSQSSGSEFGTVRVTNVAICGFVGIELDYPNGISDGLLKGIRYFKTKPNCAVFVSVKNIYKIA